MKKLRVSLVAAVVLAAAGGLAFYKMSDAKEAPVFRFATASKGDIISSVSSTGTLSAVTTVQVGTQVSGQVAGVYADFNDRVHKGQLLARIDSTLAYQSVVDAEANVERVKASLMQSQSDYDRNKKLFDAQMLAASEFSPFQSGLAIAKANLKSAQVTLDKAHQNLAFTHIYAPIDGVIVQRLVDPGQTVAASLSAPQLFLIANSLTKMQILAAVDESDIGVIKEGQPVKFTVQSYPSDPFTGTVKQVRLQSTTLNNVVNYTVVVEVENPSGKLLPGMTATVAFETGSAKDAILVPNAALRFKGTEAMIATAAAKAPARAPGDTSRNPAVNVNGPTPTRAGAATVPNPAAQRTGGFGGPGAGGRGRAGGRSGNTGQVWYVGADGQPALARVRTGLTDGTRIVVFSRDIKDSTQLIIGVTTATLSAAPSTTSNPLAPQAQNRGRGGPGGF
jgi:HlyD family secretion protein